MSGGNGTIHPLISALVRKIHGRAADVLDLYTLQGTLKDRWHEVVHSISASIKERKDGKVIDRNYQ